MTADKIKNRIGEICTLFSFEYMGRTGNVDPYSKTNFLLCFDGEEQTVHDLDEVMQTPFIAGRCLNDIAGEIKIIDW